MKDFASGQGSKNEGILYVFPIFRTDGWGQKIRRSAADDLIRVSQGARQAAAAALGPLRTDRPKVTKGGRRSPPVIDFCQIPESNLRINLDTTEKLFGTLTDCEKVRKASNSRPSAYIGTVGRELRSKSKSLPNKLFFRLLNRKYSTFVNQLREKNPLNCESILTITDFFDSLKGRCGCSVLFICFLCTSYHPEEKMSPKMSLMP